MCGSSGGNTTPPPSPPPTTFSYTSADRSNTQRRQAAMVGATQPSEGSVLGGSGGNLIMDTASTGGTTAGMK